MIDAGRLNALPARNGIRALLVEERLRATALWFVVGILAWAPFPLGSNRAWSWSLLAMLVGTCSAVWLLSAWRRPDSILRHARTVAIPMLLAAGAMAWGLAQILPHVPGGLVHPVWSMAATAMDMNLPSTISLAPWRTETELMKLGTYVLTAWIIYSLAHDSVRARLLLNAITAIGVFYVVYAWVFALVGWHQFELFYNAPDIGNRVAAPFVNKNSLAAYAGLVSLCCVVNLFAFAAQWVEARRGARRLALSAIQFAFGRGTAAILVTILSLSLVVATGSLGGTIATLVAIVAVLSVFGAGAMRARMDRWSALTAAALFVSLAGLVLLNGNALEEHIERIATSGLSEDLRINLWASAERMIRDAPLLGLGLGTFERAYPLYAQTVQPFVMDKAHNDYLELAAGWGLPAAAAWWTALAWCGGLCIKGVFTRQRDRLYPLLAIGAMVLVGVHSIFDFSLQIPAVALLFAALLGLGVAQSLPSRERRAA